MMISYTDIIYIYIFNFIEKKGKYWWMGKKGKMEGDMAAEGLE